MTKLVDLCRKCNCPLWDHSAATVNNCPRRRVYEWHGTQIIASSVDHARELLNDEFGVRFGRSRYRPKIYKGPFLVCDQYGTGDHEVSEAEYVATVETFGGGIVKEL